MPRRRSSRRRPALAALPLLAVACLGDVEVPPLPPGLFPVESPTRRARQRLEGTKPSGTAVLNHGEVLVPHDAQQSFSVELTLTEGDNLLDLTSQRPSGLESVERTLARIVYEPNFPASPTLQPVTSPTREPVQVLSGTRPPRTELWILRLDDTGAERSRERLLPASEATDWAYPLDLGDVDGRFAFALLARDGRGRASEPVDFAIALDRAPPALLSRYPQPGEVEVPTNALVQVGLDGALALSVDAPDPDALVLEEVGGARLTGILSHQPLSHALVLRATLQPSTTYRATLDAGRVADLAGNRAQAAPGDWSWTFSTGTVEDGTPPQPPTLTLPPEVDPVSGHTTAAEIVLRGSKPAWSSVWLGSVEIVAIDGATTWDATWPLGVGVNALELVARGRNGFASAPTLAQVVREAVLPAPPVLDPAPPASVDAPLVVLEGTRQVNTSVLLNGLVVVPRGADPAWVYNADLIPGVNELELRARDAQGALSEPVRLLVDFTQRYQGPVPAGFKLIVSFNLRDLANVQPVASSFDTGANCYAVDAWIEGPLPAGASCRFDDATRQRQDIAYAATLVHYVGQKQGHQNPFWDMDYRAPDYLAALVTGGVFESIGIPRSATRRDPQSGAQGGDLVDPSGRIKIRTEDLELIDGVTEATTPAGLKVIEWLPLTRDRQRLPQGEYLLHVAIGLDRAPSWVASADTETCWGDAAFSARGQHRVVKRLGLGATPFTLTLGAAAEEAAPDVERGADQLRYLAGDGITFRWVRAP